MMLEKFQNSLSPELKDIIVNKSPLLARERGRNTVYPRDLVVSFFQEDIPVINKIVEVFSISKDCLYDELLGISAVSNKQRISKKGGIDPSMAYILQHADKLVSEMEHPLINVEHVVYCFLSYNGKSKPIKTIQYILQKYGMSEVEFRKTIIEDKQDSYDLLHAMFNSERTNNFRKNKENGQNQRTEQGQKTESFPNKIEKLRVSLIEQGLIENINYKVSQKKEKFVGRKKEIQRCMRILLRKKKKNVIIIGESGTGKTSLAEGLALSIVEGFCPIKFKNTEIYSLNLGNAIAGTKYRGQFEDRMKHILFFMENANNENKKIIMFIDEIHTICNTGAAEGAVNASSMMKPLLSNGNIQCIGTSTLEEYRKNILKDDALARRFSTIYLEEPSKEETIGILKAVKHEYENFHGITITDSIIEQIVESSGRYMKNKNFPDKAFDILDEACSKMTSDGIEGDLVEDIVFDIISETTGIPITTVCGKEKETLLNLKDKISETVIGQKGAIETVSDAIKRSRFGLKDPNKPIGSFIFLGPSGTGKTLLSKTLSEILFGENRMIRLDMSEYMDKTSVNKITGSAPGYVGYEEGSKLAEEVRKRPYSVLLLDEIEKAHKDVLNVFLQILDEGRMTDSFGRVVDFRNTIIIMTSNLATSELSKKSMGFEAGSPNNNSKAAEKFLMEKVGQYFSPEFINRLDETVIFNKISKEDIVKIFDLEFKKTEKRIIQIGIKTEVSEKAKRFMCKIGYDEKYGARPMVRAIQQYLETPLAIKILSGELNDKDIVYIDHEDGSDSLLFTKQK